MSDYDIIIMFRSVILYFKVSDYLFNVSDYLFNMSDYLSNVSDYLFNVSDYLFKLSEHLFKTSDGLFLRIKYPKTKRINGYPNQRVQKLPKVKSVSYFVVPSLLWSLVSGLSTLYRFVPYTR